MSKYSDDDMLKFISDGTIADRQGTVEQLTPLQHFQRRLIVDACKDIVDTMTSKYLVVVFTRPAATGKARSGGFFCPFCQQAVLSMRAAGLGEKIHVHEMDDVERLQLAAKLEKYPAYRKQVPSVWIGPTYIGGCNNGPEDWMGVIPNLENGNLKRFVRELELKRSQNVKRVVIVGGGYAGTSVARRLKKQPLFTGDVVIVQPHQFWESPILAPYYLRHYDKVEKAFDTRKGHVVSLEKCSVPGVQYHFGLVTKINPADESIEMKDGSVLSFDVLVLCVGVHCPVISALPEQTSLKLRKAFYEETFPDKVRGSKTILIGGAGPVACEMATTIRRLNPTVHIIMVTPSAGAIPSWTGTAAKTVSRFLKRLEITMEPHQRVKERRFALEPGTYTLEHIYKKQNTKVEADMYLPYFGTCNTKFLERSIPKSTGSSGRVAVNEYLQCRAAEAIFAVGCSTRVPFSAIPNIDMEAGVVTANVVRFMEGRSHASLVRSATGEKTEDELKWATNHERGWETPTMKDIPITKLLYFHFGLGDYTVTNPSILGTIPGVLGRCCGCCNPCCPCCACFGWCCAFPAGRVFPSQCIECFLVKAAVGPYAKLHEPQAPQTALLIRDPVVDVDDDDSDLVIRDAGLFYDDEQAIKDAAVQEQITQEVAHARAIAAKKKRDDAAKSAAAFEKRQREKFGLAITSSLAPPPEIAASAASPKIVPPPLHPPPPTADAEVDVAAVVKNERVWV